MDDSVLSGGFRPSRERQGSGVGGHACWRRVRGQGSWVMRAEPLHQSPDAWRMAPDGFSGCGGRIPTGRL